MRLQMLLDKRRSLTDADVARYRQGLMDAGGALEDEEAAAALEADAEEAAREADAEAQAQAAAAAAMEEYSRYEAAAAKTWEQAMAAS